MRVFGFVLYGLRDPYTPTGITAKKPVLWLNAGLSLSQLPVEFANYILRPVLPPGKDVGENWAGDTRGGLPSGGEQAIDLPEDKLGTLGKILLPNPKAPYWMLEGSVLPAETGVSLANVKVYGRPGSSAAPTVGSVYWIESEAFYCTSVVQTGGAGSTMGYSLGLDRVACGSFAERHEIDPAGYTGNGEGDRLFLESSPNWQAHRFKGAIICWVLPKGRGGPAVELERRNFFIDSPPNKILEGNKFFYRITPRAISDVVREHRFSLAPRSVEVPFRAQVIEIESESTSSGYKCRPKKAKLALPRSKAEHLFRHVLHHPFQTVVKTVFTNDLNARIAACYPEVETRIKLKAAGDWVFRVGTITPQNIKGQSCAVVDLDLVGYDPEATIASAPPPPAPAPGTGSAGDATPPFEEGWSYYQGTPLYSGEEAPSAELRWRFNTSPIKAALIILLSRCAASGGAFDKMIGFQLGLPQSWVNLGTLAALGTELEIDPRTKEALKLDQLINETINPEFTGEDTAGSFFSDLCLLYLLMFVPLITGKVTLRRWASVLPTGLSLLRPLKNELSAGELLEPLRAVKLMSGIISTTLAPEYERTASLGGVKTLESLAAAVPVRVWKPGNAISDDALKSEAFSTFFQALFTVLGGQPRQYPVSTALEVQNFDCGDVVQWTDPRIPTPEGLGFNATRFLIVGKDVNFREGTATYKLLRDYFNESTTTNGKVAPALRIHDVKKRDIPGNYEITCLVEPIGESGWGWSDDGEIWVFLSDDQARVRVFYPDKHNSEDENDREGWAEVSARVISIREDNRLRARWGYEIVLDVDPAWDRGGLTVWYDVVRRGATIVLTDYRTPESNPENGLIQPHDSQLYNEGLGINFAKWGATKTFDQSYTLISDVP